MFNIGQVFKKDGQEICILDIIQYENRQYAFMSVESEKLEYLFYEIIQVNQGYNLNLVTNEDFNNILFSLVERKFYE